MKKLFLAICIITFTNCESHAQWKGFTKFIEAGYIGVLDTNLFAYLSGYDLYRYDTSANFDFALSDDGLLPGHTDKHVVCLGSVGSYYFAGLGGSVYRSSNYGLTWTLSSKYYGGYSFGTLGNIIFTGGDSIYRSTDEGLTWKGVTRLSASAFATLGTFLFVATNGGIWLSTDSGITWTNTNFIGSASELAVVGTTLFAATQGAGVFRSTDSAESWVAVNSGLTDLSINGLVTDGRNLFAGTASLSVDGQPHGGKGIFRSTDNGATWDTVNTGLSYPTVAGLVIFDTNLITSIMFNGITDLYIRPISQMVPPKSGVQSVSPPPADTIEVFPNPATGLVTIRSGAAIEQVSVINPLGVDLLDLPNMRQSELTLDMSKFPSGTYILRIERGGQSTLRRISVMH